jgi:hypothetical protein
MQGGDDGDEKGATGFHLAASLRRIWGEVDGNVPSQMYRKGLFTEYYFSV